MGNEEVTMNERKKKKTRINNDEHVNLPGELYFDI